MSSGAKPPTGRRSAVARYRIRLEGQIDELWIDRLGGMTVSSEELAAGGAVITTLDGCVPDQAALSGVLNCVYDLGLVLLSVERREDLRES